MTGHWTTQGDVKGTAEWVAVSESLIGSAHVRNGTPTQDSHRTWSDGSGAVIAVADGHGYEAHFRSAVGAEVATEIAIELLSKAISELRDAVVTQERLAAVVGPALVERWTAAVLDHAGEYPFTGAEQPLQLGGSDSDIVRAYGSTVIAMVATGDVLGVLQLGDGDAVVVRADGEIFQPLPTDPDLDGTRTTSLCQPDPLRSLRCVSVDGTTDPIALGFVSTDGFGGPRVDAAGWWKQVGAELLEHAREQGFDWIASKLPQWLEEPAQYGGDDTTLAVLGNLRQL